MTERWCVCGAKAGHAGWPACLQHAGEIAADLRRRALDAEAEVERLRRWQAAYAKGRAGLVDQADADYAEVEALRAEVERLTRINAEDRAARRREVEALRAERDGLQEAVDRAHGALVASAYVGGPSEREAWQTAMAALGEVATQHQSAAVRAETEGER